MLAGFDNVSGDCTIIMDADMQHPPTLIPDMLKLWEEGYDDVYAERINRGKESILRKKLSLLYYKILNRLAKTDVLPNVGDFRLLDRKCIESLKLIRETQRYTKGLYCWIGFKKKKIMFNQNDRVSGTSSFNFRKLLDLAIEGIISYTTAPLKFSTILGMLVSLAAFIYMCYVLTKTILYGDPVQGFPTLIIVILFLGGIQLISLGIIGEYLSRIFYETKNRPIYIVKEKNI
jgi:glycosyltransferase involved in cell wall biosynthesis